VIFTTTYFILVTGAIASLILVTGLSLIVTVLARALAAAPDSLF